MMQYLLQNPDQIFPLAVGALEACAGLVYLWQGKYWLALAWLAYAVACVGLAKGS